MQSPRLPSQARAQLDGEGDGAAAPGPRGLPAGDRVVQQRAAQRAAGLPETLALPTGLRGRLPGRLGHARSQPSFPALPSASPQLPQGSLHAPLFQRCASRRDSERSAAGPLCPRDGLQPGCQVHGKTQPGAAKGPAVPLTSLPLLWDRSRKEMNRTWAPAPSALQEKGVRMRLLRYIQAASCVVQRQRRKMDLVVFRGKRAQHHLETLWGGLLLQLQLQVTLGSRAGSF